MDKSLRRALVVLLWSLISMWFIIPLLILIGFVLYSVFLVR